MAQAVTLQPVSNTEDWDETLALYDTETDAALDLTGVTALTLVVWDPETNEIQLSKALNSGITITDVAGGIITMHVAASEMGDLCAKSYTFRLGMVKSGVTRDLILPGTLPIIDGGP